MSAKAEYAVRAMVQLATVDGGVRVTTDDLAQAQGIPPQFLVDILSDLRNDRLVRSHRGRDGGYELARPGDEISIADVLRSIDGPLASVRDVGLGDLPYSGPTAALTGIRRDRRFARPRRSDGRRLSRPGKQAPRPPHRRLAA
jgi:Rrf2 family protein